MADKEYAVGDEVTVKGVVTRVGSNGGNVEYTVAVNDENNDRPVSVPQKTHPAAWTNGPIELAEANQKTYDEAKKSSEEATKEQEKRDAEAAKVAREESGDNKVSDESKSKPADSKTPVTNSRVSTNK